ncbi:MAG: L-lactate permease, partial [uncultured Craurococcus sp.]
DHPPLDPACAGRHRRHRQRPDGHPRRLALWPRRRPRRRPNDRAGGLRAGGCRALPRPRHLDRLDRRALYPGRAPLLAGRGAAGRGCPGAGRSARSPRRAPAALRRLLPHRPLRRIGDRLRRRHHRRHGAGAAAADGAGAAPRLRPAQPDDDPLGRHGQRRHHRRRPRPDGPGDARPPCEHPRRRLQHRLAGALLAPGGAGRIRRRLARAGERGPLARRQPRIGDPGNRTPRPGDGDARRLQPGHRAPYPAGRTPRPRDAPPHGPPDAALRRPDRLAGRHPPDPAARASPLRGGPDAALRRRTGLVAPLPCRHLAGRGRPRHRAGPRPGPRLSRRVADGLGHRPPRRLQHLHLLGHRGGAVRLRHRHRPRRGHLPGAGGWRRGADAARLGGLWRAGQQQQCGQRAVHAGPGQPRGRGRPRPRRRGRAPACRGAFAQHRLAGAHVDRLQPGRHPRPRARGLPGDAALRAIDGCRAPGGRAPARPRQAM